MMRVHRMIKLTEMIGMIRFISIVVRGHYPNNLCPNKSAASDQLQLDQSIQLYQHLYYISPHQPHQPLPRCYNLQVSALHDSRTELVLQVWDKILQSRKLSFLFPAVTLSSPTLQRTSQVGGRIRGHFPFIVNSC